MVEIDPDRLALLRAGASEELTARLLALRPVLTVQGVVQKHAADRHTYRLRYRELDSESEYVRHRSIPLGCNEHLAVTMMTMLDRWRAGPEAALAEQKRAARKEQLSQMRENLMRQFAQFSAGGGRRHKKRVGDWFDRCKLDPGQGLWLAAGGALPQPPPRGRPIDVRLW